MKLSVLYEDRKRRDKPRCLPCHFQDEEHLAMCYLPAKIRERLLHEHKLIKNSFRDGIVPHALLVRAFAPAGRACGVF
jgi:hypothetical protein